MTTLPTPNTTEKSRTLWIDLQQGKYFLIPDTTVLPEGETTLITLTGRMQKVDPEAIAFWEVPETEAQMHIQSEVLGLFTQAKDKFAEIFTFAHPTQEAPSVGKSEEAVRATARILGVSPESLKTHPQISRVGLRNIFSSLAELLEKTISEDEEKFRAAQREVQGFRRDLLALDMDITPTLEGLPAKVRAMYEVADDKAAFQEMVDVLRVSAKELQHSPAEGGVSTEEIFARLSESLQEVLGGVMSHENQTEDYQELAHRSIEESTSGVPEFDFKKLWAEHNKETPSD